MGDGNVKAFYGKLRNRMRRDQGLNKQGEAENSSVCFLTLRVSLDPGYAAESPEEIGPSVETEILGSTSRIGRDSPLLALSERVLMGSCRSPSGSDHCFLGSRREAGICLRMRQRAGALKVPEDCRVKALPPPALKPCGDQRSEFLAHDGKCGLWLTFLVFDFLLVCQRPHPRDGTSVVSARVAQRGSFLHRASTRDRK